jgi:hypothetical protein
MQNGKLFLALFLILTCCLSCKKEQMNESNDKIVLMDKINIENGRLSFPNKTTFSEFYNTSKNESNDEIASMLDQGILFCNKENINEIYTFMSIYQINSLSDIGEISLHQKYPKFNSDGGLNHEIAKQTNERNWSDT